MVKLFANYGLAVLSIAFLSYLFFFVVMPFVVSKYKAYAERRRKYDKQFRNIKAKDQ